MVIFDFTKHKIGWGDCRAYLVVFRRWQEHNFSMSFLKKLFIQLRKLFGRPAQPPKPHAPYAGVRVPVKKGPKGRSGAVALLEPDEN
jgi:hypothetical protein